MLTASLNAINCSPAIKIERKDPAADCSSFLTVLKSMALSPVKHDGPPTPPKPAGSDSDLLAHLLTCTSDTTPAKKPKD